MLDLFWINSLILGCTALGLAYAVFNAYLISKAKIGAGSPQTTKDSQQYNQLSTMSSKEQEKVDLLLEVGQHIQDGSRTFLFEEYKVIALFVVLLATIIFFTVESQLGQMWTTVSFITGAVTSLAAGFIGMRVAVFSNYRCAYACQTSMSQGFRIAYRAGCVLGFCLTSMGVLVLIILIAIYNNWFLTGNIATLTSPNGLHEMYTKIAGYGLGASTMALFGRVGGGIFTKAADVGSDLVGKVEQNLAEDSPYNPGTIADNVGDNVGDVAGMSSDLFGSFAESTCAALVVCTTSKSFYYYPQAIYYPIALMALSIVACIICSLFAIFAKAESYQEVSNVLKWQLFISTVLLLPTIYLASQWLLPDIIVDLSFIQRTPLAAFLCSSFGLVSGMAIGFITEYYTSYNYSPVKELAKACGTGAATNIIYGLALGNQSTVLPIILLACTAFGSFTLLGMFGIALAALGMLSNMSIALAIDVYGPVSDNAGGLAEMCQLPEQTRRCTDQLDAAGNTTAAIGKGFAIGSAALVSMSLYGAFLTRCAGANNHYPILGATVDILNPLVFAGFMVGAMLPYSFSAMCMKAVGTSASDMVREIRRQLRENPGIIRGETKPDYNKCVQISTASAIRQMIAPGALVLGTPFLVGMICGPLAVAGILPGALVSGVSMATASANSGGAWDNAKKYIEGGFLIIDNKVRGKHTEEHTASIVGDTVGDPLKDTSGPALNILIKLMAIFSLVFQVFFDKTAYLLCTLAPMATGCAVVAK